MTEEEAQTYSQLVALEYDRLQMEEYENNMMVVSVAWVWVYGGWGVEGEGGVNVWGGG